MLESRKWQGVTVPCGSPRRTLKKKMGVAKLGYIGSVFRWLLVYLDEVSCVWKQYHEYFPLQVLKTHISPSHNYVPVRHPHGLMSYSCFGHFATNTSGFSMIFPVGEPLPVPKIEKLSQEMVDKYHAFYMGTLRRLFDQHKVKFDGSDTQELVKV
ncbi:acyl-CoA wax alcohol acyltransferase 2 [Rhinolophus ferrumequinum]|uniref:Acyl-CoA wax alcohol acyltransferase 2 n=1 Tax=Rhinolophus ferrumequinum TaxID=59479 RepID=A0A7J8AT02_RHIFE|nr:acyl-CoA wax alcohol acyltransferase 2 [Rhinolophus ferrumequinum]